MLRSRSCLSIVVIKQDCRRGTAVANRCKSYGTPWCELSQKFVVEFGLFHAEVARYIADWSESDHLKLNRQINRASDEKNCSSDVAQEHSQL